jgi:hypothetical protein
MAKLMQAATKALGPAILTMSPREVMVKAMQIAAQAGWWFRAAELASAVAPYVHPKLQSVTTTTGNPDESRSDDDLRAELDEIRARKRGSPREGTVEKELPEEPDELGDPGAGAEGGDPGASPHPTVQ